MSLNNDTIVELCALGAGKITKVEIKCGELLIKYRDTVDTLYLLNKGTIQIIPEANAKKPPLMRMFHGDAAGKHPMPVLGGRFFFNRTKADATYVAVTDCTVFASPSTMFERMKCQGGLLTMWREVILNSDISDVIVPIVARRLGIPCVKVESELSLTGLADELRQPTWSDDLTRLLEELFLDFVKRRADAAVKKGIDPSLMIGKPPTVKPDDDSYVSIEIRRQRATLAPPT